MKKIHFLLLLLLTPASPVPAQVNIEKSRSLEKEGFTATLDGDVALKSGNSDLFEIGLGGRMDYREKRHHTFLLGRGRYAKLNGSVYKNRMLCHMRYNYALKDWLFWEAFGQFEHDGFTLLQLRSLAGSGFRFRLFRTDRLRLFLGTSYMLERERLNRDKVVGHPVRVTAHRWSNYLSLKLTLTDTASFVNVVYIQPRLDDFGDVRVLEEAMLHFDLNQSLSFQFGFNLRYDSLPPENIEKIDITLRNGFSIRF